MNNKTFTHPTYSAAMADLKKRARKGDETPCTWDAGDGHTARAFYCAWRKRIIHTTINKAGYVIV